MVRGTGSTSPLTLSIAATSVLALATWGPVWAAEAQPGRQDVAPAIFHEPRTEAEKTLDAILKLAGREDGSSWIATEAPWRDKTKDRMFQGLFSSNLRKSWVNAEKKAVRENCNGAYLEGEMCGIDIHPITCAQDTADDYLYNTNSSSPNEAIIAYRWPNDMEVIATYRVVRIGGAWILDGVACTGYLKFNMP